MYRHFKDVSIFHVVILFCAKSKLDHQLQIRHLWHNSTVNTCTSKDCVFSLKLTNITKRGIEIAHIAEDIQKESKTFHLLYI